MRRSKSRTASQAARLAHLRTKVAKARLQKMLGNDFEVLSRGYPDLTAFNSKTGTFYFVELKSEKEIGKPLRPEQEKIRKILDKITGKKQYQVWYFSDQPSKKDKVIVECLYLGKKPEPIYPEKLSTELRNKFGLKT
jgi:hypothetical protein